MGLSYVNLFPFVPFFQVCCFPCYVKLLVLCFCSSRVRFHYGHPDVFDRLFHLTRGGVSKASKVINLSEDIFAGTKRTYLLEERSAIFYE